MVTSKLEIEAGPDDFIESETLSTTTDSSSEDQDGRNRGRTEPKTILKKLRSIKLSRMQRSRSSTRWAKSSSLPFPTTLSECAGRSEQSTPIDISDLSPNYTKATSSSNAKKESFQESTRTLTRRSSFRPAKSFTRKPSKKFRKPLMRRLSGGTDLKKKLNKSRSIKVASFERSRSIRRELQASPCHSESSFGSSNRHEKNSIIEKPELASPVSDGSVHRATCSSTLKDSKFPDHLEVQPERRESERAVVMKVCPYSYCSLHGHRHADVPPLKRFVSMRRRTLKSQKSLKTQNQSSVKAKKPGRRKKVIQTRKTTSNEHLAEQETTNGIRERSSVTQKANSFVNHVDEMLDRSLYTNMSSKAAEQQNPGTFPATEERDPECCCIGTDEDKAEATGIGNKEEVVESKPQNSDHRTNCTVDHRKYKALGPEELEDFRGCDNLSLKPDHMVSNFPEKVPPNEEVHGEVDGDTSSCLKFEEYEGDPGTNIKKSEATKFIRGSDNISNSLIASACITDTLEEPAASNEEKIEVSMPDEGFVQHADSMPNDTSSVAYKSEVENQKNIRFWHLIYQHMVTGLAEEGETQPPLSGADAEGGDLRRLPRKNEFGSPQDISETDQVASIEDHETSCHKLEFCQNDAIRLVQQAFDKILSEIPDHSSDDQSIASDVTSDQEVLLKQQEEDKEVNISTSSGSAKDCAAQDPEKMRPINDGGTAYEEEKVGEKKSEKQMPKSWSNLKKVIMLKRFVKALEKVRKLNPRKPQYLPVQRDPEAEKIHLRHQTTEERKSAEEWMLDYALRQVTSTLVPSQKRKVALLVQAFETVSPLPEIGTDMRSTSVVSFHTSTVQAYIDPSASVENGESKEKENGSEVFSKTSYAEMSFRYDLDHVSDFDAAEQHISTASFEPKERILNCDCLKGSTCMSASKVTEIDLKKEDGSVFEVDDGTNTSILTDDKPNSIDISLPNLKTEDLARTSSEKLSENTLPEVPQNTDPVFDSDVQNDESDSDMKSTEFSDLIKATDEHPAKPKTPKEVSSGEIKSRHRLLQGFPPIEKPESDSTTDVAQETKLEKQKYVRLWYLIYKHMVSSNAAENGSQALHEGAENKGQGDDASLLPGENDADSPEGFSTTEQDIKKKNYDASSPNSECHQNEVIKLVEDAIDEIPLPETEDDLSDSQSIMSDATRDQDLPEKPHGETEEQFVLTSNVSAIERLGESKNKRVEMQTTKNSKEVMLQSENVNTQKEATTVSDLGSKPKPQVKKNWSNLKKLILLRRFVKAMEKVRAFNPREARFLPSDPALESEKVHLRHQNVDDRKNAEEWMLDYALQRVVAKLTPARKRRVELLVEAFETVVPTLGS